MRWTATQSDLKLRSKMSSQSHTPMTISELRSLDEAAFNALLGSVVEHSPWVAERAWSLRGMENLLMDFIENPQLAFSQC